MIEQVVGATDDHVVTAVLIFVDAVVNTVDDVGVVARASKHIIGPCAAIDVVIAFTGKDEVVTGTAVKEVVVGFTGIEALLGFVAGGKAH